MSYLIIKIWLVVMVASFVTALIAALRLLGFFDDQQSDDKICNADDPWRVKGLVNSFRAATKQKWKITDAEGEVKERESEIDAEDALRLILEHRMKTVTALIAFAALIAVLTSMTLICIVDGKQSLSDATRDIPATLIFPATTNSASTNIVPPTSVNYRDTAATNVTRTK